MGEKRMTETMQDITEKIRRHDYKQEMRQRKIQAIEMMRNWNPAYFDEGGIEE